MTIKIHDRFEESFVVSDHIYSGFISMFRDKNPLHTEEEFAKERGFEDKVMHGNILNGFISYFIGECLPMKNVIIHTQSIQFKNPVYLNDTVFFEGVVTNIFESVNAIEFKFSFKNKQLKEVAKGKIQIGILT